MEKARIAAGKGALGDGKFKLARKAIGGSFRIAIKLGKQTKLREMVNDTKLPRHICSEIKRDINAIKRKSRNKRGVARKSIRVPNGYQLAHRRGYEDRKGYGYKYIVLQNTKNHKIQHRYDKNGRRR